jgi:hypothetical protein
MRAVSVIRLLLLATLLAGCRGAAPPDEHSFATRACKRILEMGASGCRIAKTLPETLDGCVAAIEKQTKEIPASKWIPQCFLDNTSCDAATSCLSGPK